MLPEGGDDDLGSLPEDEPVFEEEVLDSSDADEEEEGQEEGGDDVEQGDGGTEEGQQRYRDARGGQAGDGAVEVHAHVP